MSMISVFVFVIITGTSASNRELCIPGPGAKCEVIIKSSNLTRNNAVHYREGSVSVPCALQPKHVECECQANQGCVIRLAHVEVQTSNSTVYVGIESFVESDKMTWFQLKPDCNFVCQNGTYIIDLEDKDQCRIMSGTKPSQNASQHGNPGSGSPRTLAFAAIVYVWTSVVSLCVPLIK